MKWFCWMCLCGLIANLLVWSLPAILKPYRVHHWIDDWKVALVQHTSENGFGPHGLVHARFSAEYFAGNPELIAQLRQDWYRNIKNSKARRPINSGNIQYDEWGPSHIIRPDGIQVLEVGFIFTVPYSLGALVCGTILIALLVFRRWHLHKRGVVGIVGDAEPAPKVTG